MPFHFRHAICNEVYQGWDFAAACRSIRAIGYDGVEIAPFTLAEDPGAIGKDKRREYRAIMQGEGLEFVGLHWLMVAPKGLHVTTPAAALRERSWRHIENLIDLCADLAGDRDQNGVMVFGSPQQRSTTGGATREEATRHLLDGVRRVAPRAEQRRVRVLIEPLPRAQCDVMLSLAEAAAAVEEIGSPAIRTMFDVHNAIDEAEPHATLVDRYFDLIRHVHVNELDGRHPGTGDYDFLPVLGTLARRGYSGWISLEAFDFSPGAEKIAADSLHYLQGRIQKLNL
ncbi:MAG: sugar phosphate isomerase/epimerase [Bryobacteraceae bacterium]|nr:sugar phosphate isomerase/epimerase [Bryobacteraceae bacterium]